MDRQWVCDILFTLETDSIQQMINAALKNRKEKLEKTRDLVIEMRPEFVTALNNCLSFSHEKGRSANLLKTSSRRKRLRSELESVRQEENELKEDRQGFLQQVKRLKQEKQILIEQVQQLGQENQQYSQIFDNPDMQQQEVEYNM